MTSPVLDLLKTVNQVPVLAPNSRLAEVWVTQHFISSSPESGVIAEPPVKTLSQWTESILLEAHMLAGEEFPATVNHQQQVALWELAVAADRQVRDENQIIALAGLARTAERQLRQWDVYVPEVAVNEQFKSFLRWRARFKQSMKERSLATSEDRLTVLIDKLPNAEFIKLPEQIKLFGFLELTRTEGELLRQLALRGVNIERLPLDGNYEPGDCALLRYTDFDAEVSAAAHWASDALADGARQVAIVVNDLDRNGIAVRHILEQHFHADRMVSGLGMENAVFHIPTGERLLSQPVVADALLILELSVSGIKKPWPAAKISRFLLSPFLAAAPEEYIDRARLELQMRKDGLFEPSLDDIRRWLQLDKFKAIAPVLRDLLDGLDNQQASSTLAGQMAGWLKYWGWAESLINHQLTKNSASRLLKLIENLAFLRPKTTAEALHLLNTLCRDTRLVTHGGELSPVQVLSPEAAIGRRFDAARVINMRQDNWPARPKQNGLIPAISWPLLGRATVEAEFDHAEQVTGLLKLLAPTVLFSWTDHDNGVEIPASALLVHLGVPADAEVPPITFWRRLYPEQNTAQLEVRCAQPGLAFDPLENKPLPGGAGLFAEQAASPMAAYCHHRLGAQWWDLPGPFMDAAYRGQVVHAALEYLYSSAVYLDGVPADSQIPAAVDKALEKHRAPQKMTIPALAAEKIRLRQLLTEWLSLERLRPSFSPLSLECRELVDWQGFQISLRIDRVDKLENGELLIIDYKTGSTTTTGWGDKRLSNPQLPLYALLYEIHTGADVKGISLAGVRINGCVYSGYGDEGIQQFDRFRAFGGNKYGLLRHFDSWQALRAHWQVQLELLLEEIHQGHCENRVYNADQLTYMGLDSLLRVAEGKHWLSEHDDEPSC